MGDVYMSSYSAMYVDLRPLKFLHAFWSTPWWQVQSTKFPFFQKYHEQFDQSCKHVRWLPTYCWSR